jgi:catechol 2,3-dioxygenase-like lactoylglutathione lyase family enzyme
MLKEIGHIALVVQNPARTASLFKELFASKIIARKDSDGHEETFVQLGRTWFALVKADVQRARTGDHIAFSVSKSALLACAEKLRQMGQEFLFARSDTALYFYDYDNHVFELDTTDLEKDLAKEIYGQ